jgi:hypothetical protein
MFCISTWLGGERICATNKKLQVFLKLSNKFLGCVDKTILKSITSCYDFFRNVQDQVACFYKHPRRPPRYIVLYDGSTRLTSPSFMFAAKHGFGLNTSIQSILTRGVPELGRNYFGN